MHAGGDGKGRQRLVRIGQMCRVRLVWDGYWGHGSYDKGVAVVHGAVAALLDKAPHDVLEIELRGEPVRTRGKLLGEQVGSRRTRAMAKQLQGTRAVHSEEEPCPRCKAAPQRRDIDCILVRTDALGRCFLEAQD